jgi:VWFA-related protein
MFIAAVEMSAQTFRSGADAVRVDVLVTDGNRPVAGLTAEDFELRDSGVPQRVTSALIDDVPLAVLLALDTSSSVEGGTLDSLKEAAGSALDLVRPGDRAALMTFSNVVSLPAPWGPGREAAAAAVRGAASGGMTSLYDAAFTALTLRDEVPGYRNLVLLFSDGADTASWLPASAVFEKARRTEAVVYAVVLTTNATPESNTKLYQRSGIELYPPQVRSAKSGTPFAEELAGITGGDIFRANRANRAGDLRGAFTRILGEFRSRYLLTYTPTGVGAAGWHPIDVSLKTKKGKVRARRGYSR